MNFIKPLSLKNKTLLELGCGSGIISLFASSKGAKVTASDVNMIALKSLIIASDKNGLKVNIIKSDLFDNIPNENFDYIIINPPYYPQKPKNIQEQAWFCGENFEYFHNLFLQLNKYVSNENSVLMILSDDCDLKTITEIAFTNKLLLECISEKKTNLEKNYIFKIKKAN